MSLLMCECRCPCGLRRGAAEPPGGMQALRREVAQGQQRPGGWRAAPFPGRGGARRSLVEGPRCPAALWAPAVDAVLGEPGPAAYCLGSALNPPVPLSPCFSARFPQPSLHRSWGDLPGADAFKMTLQGAPG